MAGPTITKSELARMLNLSATRITQFVRTGLPELPNGKLDRSAALTWLATYKTSGRNRDKGPALAAALLAEDRQHETVQCLDIEDAASALGALLRGLGRISARMAVAAGAPMKVAFSLEHMLPIEAMKAALDLFPEPARSLIEADTEWPFGDAYDWKGDKAFWRKLAKEAGEPHDDAAWEAYREALPWCIADAKLVRSVAKEAA